MRHIITRALIAATLLMMGIAPTRAQEGLSNGIRCIRAYQHGARDSYTLGYAESWLVNDEVTAQQLGLTPSKRQELLKQVHVSQAKNDLEESDFFFVDRRISKGEVTLKDLGLTTQNYAHLKHLQKVRQAKQEFNLILDGEDEEYSLQRFLKDGVTAQELGVSQTLLTKVMHLAHVKNELTQLARLFQGDTTSFSSLETHVHDGNTTLKDLGLTFEQWERYRHQYKVLRAQALIKQDSPSLIRLFLPDYLKEGVKPEELGLTQEQVDDLLKKDP